MTGPLPGFYGPAGPGGLSANDLYAQNIGAISTIYPGKDTFSLSNQPPQHKQKKGLKDTLKDIGKGMANGAVNTIKGIFTPQGLGMMLGTAGLICAFGAPVVMPFLVGAGLLFGGSQVFKGLLDNDWQKVGEGIFTVGATATGAKFGPKQFSTKDGTFSLSKVVKNEDGVLQGVKPTGIFDSTLAYLKAPFRGFGKVENGSIAVTADGKLANSKGIMSAAGDQFHARTSSLKNREPKSNSTTSDTSSVSSTTSSTVSQKPKSNFLTQEGLPAVYGTQATITGATLPSGSRPQQP